MAQQERRFGEQLDLSRAEHLANRFGFGASLEELRAMAGRRPGEVFDDWLEDSAAPERRELYLVRWEEYGANQDGAKIPSPTLDPLSREDARARRRELRLVDKGQFNDYLGDWFEGLRTHRDPLRDRMALFWHDFFPTSVKVVRRRFECIHQHTMLRQRALGSFAELLEGIVCDPAMLGYFDNDTNGRTHPNENFARELLELYSLGEGNYSEVDVRETARALTGYQGESGHFVFDEELHDPGEKHILGATGAFRGEDLPEILLAQPACARHLCRKLLYSFEGVPPDAQRLEEYAAALRAAEFRILPLLRKLCTDPRFYREQLHGWRVQGPIEWLVGAARRLGLAPPPDFVYFAAAALGQQFYAPPTVNGWDAGEAWLSHSSLLLRGKCLEMLLHHSAAAPASASKGGVTPVNGETEQLALIREVHAYELPQPDLLALASHELGPKAEDGVITRWAASAWLARPPLASTQPWLLAQLAEVRAERDIHGPLLRHPGAEHALRRLACNLLSLPLGQLN